MALESMVGSEFMDELERQAAYRAEGGDWSKWKEFHENNPGWKSGDPIPEKYLRAQ